MNSAHQSRRVLWLVRLLTSTGLFVVIITLAVVGRELWTLRGARAFMTAEQQRLNRASDRLRHLAVQSRVELSETLDGRAVRPARYAAASELGRFVQLELGSRPDAAERESLGQFDGQVSGLIEVARRAAAWRAELEPVQSDIAEQRTVTRVRALTVQLQAAVNSAEGRNRLNDALRYRRWRHAAGEEAARQAAKILVDQARRQTLGWGDFDDDLAEFARLMEVLGGEDEEDALAHLKDDHIAPVLDSMSRLAATIDATSPDTGSITITSISDVRVAVFGEGYTVDRTRQSIRPGIGGLFPLMRDAVRLRREREKLEARGVDVFEGLEAANASFAQMAQARSAALAQQMERSLAQAWREMSIFGGGCSLLFLFLSTLISRGIKGQLGALVQARQDAEEGRQTTHKLLLEQQAAGAQLAAAHHEQRISEGRLRTLSALVPIGICECDARGGVVYVNPHWLHITQLTLEQSSGDGWERALDPLDAAVASDWKQAAARGEPFNREFRFRAIDGQVRWVSAHTTAVRSEAGELLGHVGTVEDITDRKRADAELESVHRKLLETSRQAGMAEVATGVLHNVGNVLNSVNVSSSLVADGLRKSRVSHLGRVVAMMRSHEADLGAFLTGDAAGKQIPGFLAQLADHLAAEQATGLAEVAHLQKNIEHIKEIVTTQQAYAGAGRLIEPIDLRELLDDALRIHRAGIARHDIGVVIELADVPPVSADKHKVLHILVNLIANAKHAMKESPVKTLTLRVEASAGRVRVSVRDTGYGIAPENMTRIFAHGFTTKTDGHGFGLHSGALAASELGGSLHAASDGPGHGAVFTLELPLAAPLSAAA